MPSLCSTSAAATAALLAFAPVALAWNEDVHQQIGFLAEQFLTKRTSTVLAQILEPEYNGSIGNAAAWADEFAHTDEGAYSYQWHWIDSADDPPSYCNVYYHRDCPRGGCVVSAIANQTAILRDCIASPNTATTNVNVTCSRAVKWLAHFTGDIAQPLHASGRAAGGNGQRVTYAGANVTLHSVWDGHIIHSAANLSSSSSPPAFSNASIHPFFSERLLPRILADAYPESPAATWLACADPRTPAACALAWARDSNAWLCDYVYAQLHLGTGTADLATSGYAEDAFPIVELQVSKAALRLATWLNALVEGSYEEESELVVQTTPRWIGGPGGGA